MKKILIVSDTHGSMTELFEVISRERPFDIFVHCGDVCESTRMLEAKLSDSIVHIVAGNCDYTGDLPPVKEFNIGKIKAIATHGHRYHADYDPSSLFYLAREREADIVMYGHSHVPILIQEQGVTILNPGSLCRPRQADRKPTYCVMTIDDKNEMCFEWKTASGSRYEV